MCGCESFLKYTLVSDKNYDWLYGQYFVGEKEGIVYPDYGLYPLHWKLDCNNLTFNQHRGGGGGTEILLLSKKMLQYKSYDKLETFYNPDGDENGNIRFKSDLGEFDLNKIIGLDWGVNTISKYNSGEINIRMTRVNKNFPQTYITIEIKDTELDKINFPFEVPKHKFTIDAGLGNYINDTLNSKLTIKDFKNDTIKGTFSAKMNINRKSYTPITDPDTINLTEGTFAMKLYKNE